MNLARLFVWVLGGFVFGSTLCVVASHLKQWRRGVGRLLPLHIWTIALSYDLLVLSLMTRTGPLDWRAWIFIPALCLGAVAMLVMLRHQHHQRSDT